jgi:hypothetical protein
MLPVLFIVVFFLVVALFVIDLAIWLAALLLFCVIGFALWLFGALPAIGVFLLLIGGGALIFKAVAALIQWDGRRMDRNAKRKALGLQRYDMTHEDYLWANRLGRYADPSIERPE